MTTFDEREQAYEAKLAHDEELKFKANVRRNKWLGLWAAEKLGKVGKAAEDYASALVAAQLEGKSEEAVFRKIRDDFNAAGMAQSDHQIRREMEDLLAKASKEVIASITQTK
jgi:hypothetical protein